MHSLQRLASYPAVSVRGFSCLWDAIAVFLVAVARSGFALCSEPLAQWLLCAGMSGDQFADPNRVDVAAQCVPLHMEGGEDLDEERIRRWFWKAAGLSSAVPTGWLPWTPR